MMKKLLLALVVIFLSINMLFSVEYTTENKELKGSNISILAPAEWNGKLLVIAHGLRIEGSGKSSHISIDGFISDLLKDNWMIAKTSYRRNGMIVRDAIEDIEYLTAYIQSNYGKYTEKYLYGRSMGGMVGINLAEGPNSGYKGILALGAGMRCYDADNPLKLTYAPHIPIFFLSNKTEVKHHIEYIKDVSDEAVKPVLWKIDRPGHCNANELELKETFAALQNWVAGEKPINNRTVLYDMKNEVISDARFEADKLYITMGKPTSSFTLNLKQQDLEKLGIEYKTHFRLSYKGREYHVFWGDTYGDVQYACWVSFFQANGRFRVARNYANAATMLNYTPGDEVEISKIEKQAEWDNFYIPEALELGTKAWDAILKKDFAKSIELGKQALDLQDIIWVKVNLLHAYLLSGNYPEAKKTLNQNLRKPFISYQGYFEQSVLEDFDYLKKNNLTHPDMEKIVNLIKQMEAE